jgi:hypothetical protein
MTAAPTLRRGGVAATSTSAPRWSLTQWTVAISVTAFIVRAVLVLSTKPNILPTDDAGDYQRLAVSLAGGHGWGAAQYAPGAGPTAFRPPLYPLFLAAIYKVFGVHMTLGRLGGAVLGAGAVACLIVATRILWGQRIAITAGIVAAFFPPMVMASSAVMSEALAVPLVIATVTSALVYRSTGRSRWVVLSGIALGLSVLTRPNLAVLVVPIVLLTVVRPLAWRRLVPGLVVVVAGTLVVTPWLVRDRVVFHQWVPLTTQDGVVVAGTYNHTSATSASAMWIPFTWDKADRALLSRHPKAGEIEESSLLETAATNYAEAHPAYVAHVAFENTRRTFDLVSPTQTEQSLSRSYGLTSLAGDLDAVSAVLVLALSIAGLVLRRGRQIPIAYLAIPWLVWATTVVLQGMPRLRAVIDPFLAQFAAVALVAGWAAVTRRQMVAAQGAT